MNAPNVTDLDCRGLACPAPILRLAKAARKLPPGALVRVVADDGDFVRDVEAWCSSAKAALQSVDSVDGTHTAVIRLKGGAEDAPSALAERKTVPVEVDPEAKPATKAATRVIDSMSETAVEEIDCRGMKCPAPVLAIARQRRAAAGEPRILHVLADDEDFPADLQAWAKSTSSDIFEFGEESGVFSVLVGIFGAQRPAAAPPSPDASKRATSKTPAVPRREQVENAARPAASAPPSVPSPLTARAARVDIDARGLKCPAPILKVAKAAKKAGSAPTLLFVQADDCDFPPDIRAWASSTGAEIISITESDSVFETVIATNGASLDSLVTMDSGPGRASPQAAPAAQAPPRHAVPAPVANVGDAQAGAPLLDAREMDPPLAMLHLGQLLVAHTGGPVHVVAPCGAFESSLFAWASATQARVENIQRGNEFRADVVMPGAQGIQQTVPTMAAAPTAAPAVAEPDQVFDALVARGTIDPEAAPRENLASLLVLHNDFEKLLAAMMIANTSAAQGMRVEIFFSFWGVNLLRGDRPRQSEGPSQANWMQKMMKMMMPKGPGRQKLSKMHMGGMGKGMLTMLMRKNNVMSLDAMVQDAIEQDIKFIVCTMSMGIMGIEKRDLMDLPNMEYAGVTSFVANSRRASLSLVF